MTEVLRVVAAKQILAFSVVSHFVDVYRAYLELKLERLRCY
jgi:hypothetical protein